MTSFFSAQNSRGELNFLVSLKENRVAQLVEHHKDLRSLGLSLNWTP